MDTLKSLESYAQFNCMTEEERKKFISYCEDKNFKKNDIIFNEGEAGNTLYIVKEGIVKIYLKGEKETEQEEDVITILKNGDMFGEMSIFTDQPRSASAKVVTDSEFIILSKEKFELLKNESPTIAVKLMEIFLRILSKRLRSTTMKLYGHF